MYTLILDTSNEAAFIALAKEGKLIAERVISARNNASKWLLTLTHELMSEQAIDFADLKAIAVGVGPGSFTGMRAAASFAMGLSPFGKPPLIGFSSLAACVYEKEGLFASIVEARNGTFFACKCHYLSHDHVVSLEPAAAFSRADLADLEKSVDYFVSSSPLTVSLAKPLYVVKPNALFVAKIIERSYADGHFSDKLDLIYLKGTPKAP